MSDRFAFYGDPICGLPPQKPKPAYSSELLASGAAVMVMGASVSGEPLSPTFKVTSPFDKSACRVSGGIADPPEFHRIAAGRQPFDFIVACTVCFTPLLQRGNDDLHIPAGAFFSSVTSRTTSQHRRNGHSPQQQEKADA